MESNITIIRQACQVPGHNLSVLNFLCFNPACTSPKKLLCRECLKGHENCEATNRIDVHQASNSAELLNKPLYQADIQQGIELVQNDFSQLSLAQIQNELENRLNNSCNEVLEEIRGKLEIEKNKILNAFKEDVKAISLEKYNQTYLEVEQSFDQEPVAKNFLAQLEAGQTSLVENGDNLKELVKWRSDRNKTFTQLHQMSVMLIKIASYFDHKKLFKPFLDDIPYEKLKPIVTLDWKWNPEASQALELSFDCLTATNQVNESSFVLGTRAMLNGHYRWQLDMTLTDNRFDELFTFGIIEPHFVQDLYQLKCEKSLSMTLGAKKNNMIRKSYVHSTPTLYVFDLDLVKGTFSISQSDEVICEMSSGKNILGKCFLPFVCLPRGGSARIIV